MDIFQEVKDRISTRQAAEYYGLSLSRKGNKYWCLCPFHSDRNPSMGIYQDGGFKCFSCGTGGADCIALVAKMFKLSMAEAAKKLVVDFSLPVELSDQAAVYKSNPDEVTYSDFITGLYQWRDETFDWLCRVYRITRQLLNIWSPEEELFPELVLILGDVDTWTDILIYGELLDIFELYKHFKGLGWGCKGEG